MEHRRLTALPSPAARGLAFAAVLLGGLCGGLIGSAVIGIQCTGDCSTPKAIGALIGALLCAGGVSVIAVLTLRAMGEWKQARPEALNRDLHVSSRTTMTGPGPSNDPAIQRDNR